MRHAQPTRRATTVLAVAALLGGCSEPEPRPLDTLVAQGDRYLDPADFEPYTGPVVSTYPGAADAVEMRASLRDGRLHGPYERYYPSGALLGRGSYREGRWEGPFESFYEDGTPWMRGQYRAGALHGPHVTYAEDGSVEEEGTYDMGEPCGSWTVDGERVERRPCEP